VGKSSSPAEGDGAPSQSPVESSTSAEYPDLRSRRRGGDYQSQCATPFRRHLEEEGEVAADKAEAGTILNPNSETTLFGSSVTSSKDTLTFFCVWLGQFCWFRHLELLGFRCEMLDGRLEGYSNSHSTTSN
jgi:hypothetical protein